MPNDFSILSARFESLSKPLGPGLLMRGAAQTRNIRRIAFPILARMADQKIGFLCLGLEGYFQRFPQPDDRLFVGYSRADEPTSVVYLDPTVV